MPNHRFASGADEKLVRVFDATKNFLDNVSSITGHDFTGYSLSDHQILSPINPKQDDWFCQIYTNCSEIQNLENLCFSISEQFVYLGLRKSDKISRCIFGYLVTKYVDLTKNNLYSEWTCFYKEKCSNFNSNENEFIKNYKVQHAKSFTYYRWE